MQTIQTIRLDNTLPRVFREADNPRPAVGDSSVDRSSVWLHDIEFTRGCRLCIQAESGSGKSSLLSYLCGERSDYDGNIFFDGTNIRQFDIQQWSELRLRHLALLPQEMRLFGELTPLENIAIKNSLTGCLSDSQIRNMLDRIGLPAGALKRRTDRLSVGQQQRVAIVRALSQPFDFLLLDEPVSHLDRECNIAVSELVDERATQCGAAIITTSVGNPLLLPEAITITL